ncbi:hypothetical protein IFM47457_05949 [Aspergillus lentulus]|nr:hypothetical protein IFM47457_05949 [Aspergillus lentulus]
MGLLDEGINTAIGELGMPLGKVHHRFLNVAYNILLPFETGSRVLVCDPFKVSFYIGIGPTGN